ncbi:MAG: 4-hydroxythreonine-4-phosphate dehydrogenase PdxA [Burkholderiaceae bacterium]|jgi:4-hydroxythreonine-4-phosphate dehydrogenase|nr:4-hydroxythreonine-4-phosphate dehydrogenase PdxA [Burkholderiaceae bacterium]
MHAACQIASPPLVAVTTGEPAGIGPEIALRASWALRHKTRIVLIGDWRQLENLALAINPDIRLSRLKTTMLADIRAQCGTSFLPVLHCPLSQPVSPGHPDPYNAKAILNGLDIAIQGAMDHHVDAIATAPVQKSSINAAGIAFTGHTEYLAEKTQTDQVVMLLAGLTASAANGQPRPLRVALATTHLPLSTVPAAISHTSLLQTLHILHQALRKRFGIAEPRIMVSGLNPHAGENGYLGTEEADTILPAIQTAQQQGINATGPFPADTLFLPHHLEQADCFLVMYHDQGLPVLKYATFGQGVNITLGLPLIRTSVDHGTALDIAIQGTGLADAGSMTEAIRIAAEMAARQQLVATSTLQGP